MWARLLKYLNRFTAYRSYLILLKLCRMITDIDLHNQSEPGPPRGAVWSRLLKFSNLFESLRAGFSDFLPGLLWGRALKCSNHFTAYTTHAIELELRMMIPNISLYTRCERDFQAHEEEGFQNFSRRHLYMFFCFVVAEISISSI